MYLYWLEIDHNKLILYYLFERSVKNNKDFPTSKMVMNKLIIDTRIENVYLYKTRVPSTKDA